MTVVEKEAVSTYRAEVFRALSDPVRLEIVEYLKDRERCVCEIFPAFGKVQSTISKHLDILYTAGILDRRTEGQRTLYRIKDSRVFRLMREADVIALSQISALTKVAKILEVSSKVKR